MNINRINNVHQVYKSTSANRIDKTEKTSGARDVVNISGEAKDFQTAFAAAMKATSDDREDVVSGIKQKIDSGEYEENIDNLVDKILKK